jgi:hypothetical protein
LINLLVDFSYLTERRPGLKSGANLGCAIDGTAECGWVIFARLSQKKKKKMKKI